MLEIAVVGSELICRFISMRNFYALNSSQLSLKGQCYRHSTLLPTWIARDTTTETLCPSWNYAN